MASSFLHCSPSSILSSSSKPKRHYLAPSRKPIKITMLQNQSSWATIYSDVEAHIELALSGHEPAVFEPMHHLIFAAPKSMAPALCIAACETVGGQKDQAIIVASSLHLMHASTFTHENLQLSDQPMIKPMAHHGLGSNIELLIADGMLPFGYELLATLDDPTKDDPDRILRVIIEIARTMGSEGMVNGQYLLTRCTGSDGDESFEEGLIDQVLEKKEGGLYACGAACGVILGGGTDEEVEKLRRFGLYIGMIHGITLHDGLGGQKKLLKMVDSLSFLAHKELEGMKERNVEPICSLMDRFLATI